MFLNSEKSIKLVDFLATSVLKNTTRETRQSAASPNVVGLVQQVIRESGYEEVLSSGVVITGGSAVMPGMVELGEDIFLKPVRVGVPEYRGNLHEVVKSPRYSTVMGLLQEGCVQRMRFEKAAPL